MDSKVSFDLLCLEDFLLKLLHLGSLISNLRHKFELQFIFLSI